MLLPWRKYFVCVCTFNTLVPNQTIMHSWPLLLACELSLKSSLELNRLVDKKIMSNYCDNQLIITFSDLIKTIISCRPPLHDV